MIKRILKVGICICLGFLIFSRLTSIFNWKTSADTELYNCQHFYDSPDQTMDVIFYGSSHCFCSINPAILWRDYEIAGFDFASGCQNLGNTYFYMKESLKTQKPQVMFVEAFYFGRNGYGSGDVYRNTLGLELSKNYLDNVLYTTGVSGSEQGNNFELLFRWPIIHSRYKELGELDFNDYLYFQRGYRLSFETKPIEQPEEVFIREVTTLTEDYYVYIDKMIELADEANIDIVFFAAPYDIDSEQQVLFNTLEQYLLQRNVDFINFNSASNPANIDYERDIWDGAHLNDSGAEKVTKYIGDYLIANYDFGYKKDDLCYRYWDENLDYYERVKQENKLLKSNNLGEGLANIEGLNDIVIISGNLLENEYGDTIKTLLNVDSTELQKYDAVILHNGSFYKGLECGEFFYGEINGHAIISRGDTEQGWILGVDNFRISPESGLGILVYNEIDGRCILNDSY